MTTSTQQTIDITIAFLDNIAEQLFASGGWPVIHELNSIRNQLTSLVTQTSTPNPIDVSAWHNAVQRSVEDARSVFDGCAPDAMDAIEFMAALMQNTYAPTSTGDQLTNEEIDAIADSMPGGLEGFLKGWGWRQFAHAVLDANEIKMNQI